MSDNKIASSSISDQARAWFSRLQADDVSNAEREQFKQWYHENSQHAEAYEKTRLFWEMLKIPAQQVHDKLATDTARTINAPINTRKTAVSRYATMTLMLVILLFNPVFNKYQHWHSDYHTEAGKQITVALTDGSQVILNTDTALNVVYTAQERRIQLLHGEAYFKVAHNKNRPFIVSNGATETQAVGTAFTVKESGNNVQVLVSEGTVKVSVHNSDSTALVHINQQINYQRDQLGTVSAANVFDALAWQRGQLIFKQQPLARVIAEINRYHAGQIVLMNPALKKRVVSGVFNTDDPHAAIDALKATLNIMSVELSEQYVLLY